MRALLTLLALLLGSCLSPHAIKIYTDQPATVTIESPTYRTIPQKGRVGKIMREKDTAALVLKVRRKAMVEVETSDKPLVIKTKFNSATKEFHLMPKKSIYQRINKATGNLIFHNTEDSVRYTYNTSNFLSSRLNSITPPKFAPPTAKRMNLVVSIPWVNSFHFQPDGEPSKTNTGFLGLTVGLDKYYKPSKFVNVNIGEAWDFLLPFPAPYDHQGEWESMVSSYISVTDNFQFRYFSFGYGLNYSKNQWVLNSRPEITEPIQSIRSTESNTVGITLNSYWQATPHFYVGLIYRPTLWQIEPVQIFKYEHVISFDLLWRIRLINDRGRFL